MCLSRKSSGEEPTRCSVPSRWHTCGAGGVHGLDAECCTPPPGRAVSHSPARVRASLHDSVLAEAWPARPNGVGERKSLE